VNPTLFDYSETTTDWLQHLYRNLGIFQGELRAKVLASIDEFRGGCKPSSGTSCSQEKA